MTLLTMARYEWFEEWEGTKLGRRGQNYVDMKNSMAQEMLDWALTIFPQLQDKVLSSNPKAQSIPLFWGTWTVPHPSTQVSPFYVLGWVHIYHDIYVVFSVLVPIHTNSAVLSESVCLCSGGDGGCCHSPH